MDRLKICEEQILSSSVPVQRLSAWLVTPWKQIGKLFYTSKPVQ
jgi:hypothetical protein